MKKRKKKEQEVLRVCLSSVDGDGDHTTLYTERSIHSLILFETLLEPPRPT